MKGTKEMKHTTKGAVALAAAVALGLAACQPAGTSPGGNTSTNKPSEATNTGLAKSAAQINEQPRDNIKDGGTLTTSVPEISAQFNTFQADGTLYTLNVWQWYNPVLALYSPEGEWSFNKDYLDDVTAKTEGENTVVTYKINEKATFNDGTPIDWTAFEATWKANSGKDEAYLASSTDGYDKIVSVAKGESDKVAVVTFGSNWAWWKGQFNVLLHPKAAADAKTYNEAYVENPHAEWGAGPYTVKSYDKTAGTIVFERNPKWWGDTGKLDQRIFKAMETQASLNAFKNGELDTTGVAAKDRLAQVQGMKDVEIRTSATPSTFLLTLNSASPTMADAKVRQAVVESVDRATILKISFDGLNYTEEAPGSFTLFPFQKGYQDNVAAAGIKFDTASATKALESSGYAKGSDGFYAKDGKVLDLQFVLFGDSPVSKARATALQAMLKTTGIKMTIVNKPSSEFSAVMKAKQWDLIISGFASSDPFGQAYFCQIWCSNSSLNRSGTGTKELDAKIEEATKLPDADAQTKRMNEIEVEALKTYGIFPLFNGPTMVAVKKGLANSGAGLFFVGKPQDIGWQK